MAWRTESVKDEASSWSDVRRDDMGRHESAERGRTSMPMRIATQALAPLEPCPVPSSIERRRWSPVGRGQRLALGSSKPLGAAENEHDQAYRVRRPARAHRRGFARQ
jgi:hypothetical protein